jgi:hypothetical protein
VLGAALRGVGAVNVGAISSVKSVPFPEVE